MRKALLVLVTLAAAVVLAAGPAAAVTENLTVRSTATLSPTVPGAANFSGFATCNPDPVTGSETGTLTLQAFRIVNGGLVPIGEPFTTTVRCNGTSLEWATTLPGPFVSGEVVTVNATLVGANGTTTTRNYLKVKIV